MKKNEIFTVENAKVVDREYMYYPVHSVGYVKNGDCIMHVTVSKMTFDLKKQEVTTFLTGSDGKEIVKNGEFNMFRTPEDFKENSHIPNHTKSTQELIKAVRELPHPNFESFAVEDVIYKYACVWRFENGEPVNTPVVVNIVNYGDDGFTILDGHLPEKFWDTREKAFRYNEYKVVDDDGEVFIEQGIQKRLALTEEQKAIVDELSELFKKAANANIAFICDRYYDDSLRAFNGEYVVDYGYEAGHGDIEGDEIPFNELEFARTGASLYGYNSEEDEYRICMKPTARQVKKWKKDHPDQN